MDDEKKDLEALRGLTHSGAVSRWSAMRYRSLIRQYPRHYLRYMDESKGREDGKHRPSA